MIKLLRKFIAMICRTFYAECPKCLRHFYGFNDHASHVQLDKHYRIVCHRCAKELQNGRR